MKKFCKHSETKDRKCHFLIEIHVQCVFITWPVNQKQWKLHTGAVRKRQKRRVDVVIFLEDVEISSVRIAFSPNFQNLATLPQCSLPNSSGHRDVYCMRPALHRSRDNSGPTRQSLHQKVATSYWVSRWWNHRNGNEVTTLPLPLTLARTRRFS